MVTNTQVLNPDGSLNDAFKAQLTDLLNGLMEKEEVQYSSIVKEFVDGQIADLENKLVNNEKWTEIQKNIDALLDVFDANEDSELSPAEVLAKFGEVKNATTTNANAIANVSARLEENVKTLTASISKVSAKVDAVSENLNKTAADFGNKLEAAKKDIAANTNAIKTQLSTEIDGVKGNVTKIEADLTAKIAADKKEVLDNVTALKSNIENEVNTVRSKAEEIAGNLGATDAKVTGVVSAIEGIAEAFEEAAKKIDDRMASVRNIFGLKAPKTTGNNGNIGDGAIV